MKRVISLGISFSLISTNPFTLPALAFPLDQAGVKISPQNLSAVQVPGPIGKIQEFHKGQGSEVVILIQDAHAIPEAQRSIQKLVDYFEKEYGIRVVALEGASSKLDLQIFKSFPDKTLLKKTFEEYLERGELTGAVAAALYDDLLFQGIEDWNLYEEALALYLKALEKEPELLKKLEAKRQRIKERKKKIYSPKLLEIDQALETFQESRADLIEVLRKLASVKRPKEGSELALLFSAEGGSASGGEEVEKQDEDTSSIDTEVRRIAEKIRSSLSAKKRGGFAFGERAPRHSEGEARRISGTEILPLRSAQGQDDALRTFNQKFQAFQTSQISAPDFALFMKELTEKGTGLPAGQAGNTSLPVPFSVSERLSRLIQNQKRLRDLEGTRFFRDFETYADSVKQTLFRSGLEKALDRETHRLRLLENLVRLKLTPEEWKRIKEYPSLFPLPAQRGEDWGEGARLSAHLAFYENAEKRDEVFFRHLMELMNERRSAARYPLNAILFIAGGFHAEGLTQRLKEKNISYVLLAPQMNSVPKETSYHNLMRGEVSWKDYFEVEQGKVNLYKAFVRGTRDRLLKQVEGGGWKVEGKTEPSSFGLRPSTFHLLKEWRDQLIRDLAQKGEITKAREYTPFLDELTKPDSQKPWRVQLERFIQSLRQLESQGKLTEQNVLRLLRSVTVLQAVGNASGAPRSELRVMNPGLGVSLLPGVFPEVASAFGPQPSAFPSRAEVRAEEREKGKGKRVKEQPDSPASLALTSFLLPGAKGALPRSEARAGNKKKDDIIGESRDIHWPNTLPDSLKTKIGQITAELDRIKSDFNAQWRIPENLTPALAEVLNDFGGGEKRFLSPTSFLTELRRMKQTSEELQVLTHQKTLLDVDISQIFSSLVHGIGGEITLLELITKNAQLDPDTRNNHELLQSAGQAVQGLITLKNGLLQEAMELFRPWLENWGEENKARSEARAGKIRGAEKVNSGSNFLSYRATEPTHLSPLVSTLLALEHRSFDDLRDVKVNGKSRFDPKILRPLNPSIQPGDIVSIYFRVSRAEVRIEVKDWEEFEAQVNEWSTQNTIHEVEVPGSGGVMSITQPDPDSRSRGDLGMILRTLFESNPPGRAYQFPYSFPLVLHLVSDSTRGVNRLRISSSAPRAEVRTGRQVEGRRRRAEGGRETSSAVDLRPSASPFRAEVRAAGAHGSASNSTVSEAAEKAEKIAGWITAEARRRERSDISASVLNDDIQLRGGGNLLATYPYYDPRLEQAVQRIFGDNKLSFPRAEVRGRKSKAENMPEEDARPHSVTIGIFPTSESLIRGIHQILKKPDFTGPVPQPSKKDSGIPVLIHLAYHDVNGKTSPKRTYRWWKDQKGKNWEEKLRSILKEDGQNRNQSAGYQLTKKIGPRRDVWYRIYRLKDAKEKKKSSLSPSRAEARESDKFKVLSFESEEGISSTPASLPNLRLTTSNLKPSPRAEVRHIQNKDLTSFLEIAEELAQDFGEYPPELLGKLELALKEFSYFDLLQRELKASEVTEEQAIWIVTHSNLPALRIILQRTTDQGTNFQSFRPKVNLLYSHFDRLSALRSEVRVDEDEEQEEGEFGSEAPLFDEEIAILKEALQRPDILGNLGRAAHFLKRVYQSKAPKRVDPKRVDSTFLYHRIQRLSEPAGESSSVPQGKFKLQSLREIYDEVKLRRLSQTDWIDRFPEKGSRKLVDALKEFFEGSRKKDPLIDQFRLYLEANTDPGALEGLDQELRRLESEIKNLRQKKQGLDPEKERGRRQELIKKIQALGRRKRDLKTHRNKLEWFRRQVREETLRKEKVIVPVNDPALVRLVSQFSWKTKTGKLLFSGINGYDFAELMTKLGHPMDSVLGQVWLAVARSYKGKLPASEEGRHVYRLSGGGEDSSQFFRAEVRAGRQVEGRRRRAEVREKSKKMFPASALGPQPSTSPFRAEVRKGWEEEIANFSPQEREIFERARKIKGLRIGMDIEGTLTTHVFRDHGFMVDLAGAAPHEVFGGMQAEELRRRLVAPGMAPLLLGLLENNEITIVTSMGEGLFLLLWQEAVPFLHKLIRTESIPVVFADKIAEIAKENITFRKTIEEAETLYWLNEIPFTPSEIETSIHGVIDEGELIWRALKLPAKLDLDVLVDDRTVLRPLLQRLDMGKVIIAPRYFLKGEEEEAFSFYRTPYEDEKGPGEDILIDSEQAYQSNVTAVLPVLEALEKIRSEEQRDFKELKWLQKNEEWVRLHKKKSRDESSLEHFQEITAPAVLALKSLLAISLVATGIGLFFSAAGIHQEPIFRNSWFWAVASLSGFSSLGLFWFRLTRRFWERRIQAQQDRLQEFDRIVQRELQDALEQLGNWAEFLQASQPIKTGIDQEDVKKIPETERFSRFFKALQNLRRYDLALVGLEGQTEGEWLERQIKERLQTHLKLGESLLQAISLLEGRIHQREFDEIKRHFERIGLILENTLARLRRKSSGPENSSRRAEVRMDQEGGSVIADGIKIDMTRIGEEIYTLYLQSLRRGLGKVFEVGQVYGLELAQQVFRSAQYLLVLYPNLQVRALAHWTKLYIEAVHRLEGPPDPDELRVPRREGQGPGPRAEVREIRPLEDLKMVIPPQDDKTGNPLRINPEQPFNGNRHHLLRGRMNLNPHDVEFLGRVSPSIGEIPVQRNQDSSLPLGLESNFAVRSGRSDSSRLVPEGVQNTEKLQGHIFVDEELHRNAGRLLTEEGTLDSLRTPQRSGGRLGYGPRLGSGNNLRPQSPRVLPLLPRVPRQHKPESGSPGRSASRAGFEGLPLSTSGPSHPSISPGLKPTIPPLPGQGRRAEARAVDEGGQQAEGEETLEDKINEIVDLTQVDPSNLKEARKANNLREFLLKKEHQEYLSNPDHLGILKERFRKFGKRVLKNLDHNMFAVTDLTYQTTLFLMIVHGSIKQIVWEGGGSVRERAEKMGVQIQALYNIYPAELVRSTVQELVSDESRPLYDRQVLSEELEWFTGYDLKAFLAQPDLFTIFSDEVVEALKVSLEKRKRQLGRDAEATGRIDGILRRFQLSESGKIDFRLTHRDLSSLWGGNLAGDCTACGTFNHWTEGSWNATLENMELHTYYQGQFFSRMIFVLGKSEKKPALWVHAVEFTPLSRQEVGSQSQFRSQRLQEEILMQTLKFLAEFAKRAKVKSVFLTPTSNSWGFVDIMPSIMQSLVQNHRVQGEMEQPFSLISGLDSSHQLMRRVQPAWNRPINIYYQNWHPSVARFMELKVEQPQEEAAVSPEVTTVPIGGVEVEKALVDTASRPVMADVLRVIRNFRQSLQTKVRVAQESYSTVMDQLKDRYYTQDQFKQAMEPVISNLRSLRKDLIATVRIFDPEMENDMKAAFDRLRERVLEAIPKEKINIAQERKRIREIVEYILYQLETERFKSKEPTAESFAQIITRISAHSSLNRAWKRLSPLVKQVLIDPTNYYEITPPNLELGMPEEVRLRDFDEAVDHLLLQRATGGKFEFPKNVNNYFNVVLTNLNQLSDLEGVNGEALYRIAKRIRPKLPSVFERRIRGLDIPSQIADILIQNVPDLLDFYINEIHPREGEEEGALSPMESSLTIFDLSFLVKESKPNYLKLIQIRSEARMTHEEKILISGREIIRDERAEEFLKNLAEILKLGDLARRLAEQQTRMVALGKKDKKLRARLKKRWSDESIEQTMENAAGLINIRYLFAGPEDQKKIRNTVVRAWKRARDWKIASPEEIEALAEKSQTLGEDLLFQSQVRQLLQTVSRQGWQPAEAAPLLEQINRKIMNRGFVIIYGDQDPWEDWKDEIRFTDEITFVVRPLDAVLPQKNGDRFFPVWIVSGEAGSVASAFDTHVSSAQVFKEAEELYRKFRHEDAETLPLKALFEAEGKIALRDKEKAVQKMAWNFLEIALTEEILHRFQSQEGYQDRLPTSAEVERVTKIGVISLVSRPLFAVGHLLLDWRSRFEEVVEHPAMGIFNNANFGSYASVWEIAARLGSKTGRHFMDLVRKTSNKKGEITLRFLDRPRLRKQFLEFPSNTTKIVDSFLKAGAGKVKKTAIQLYEEKRGVPAQRESLTALASQIKYLRSTGLRFSGNGLTMDQNKLSRRSEARRGEERDRIPQIPRAEVRAAEANPDSYEKMKKVILRHGFYERYEAAASEKIQMRLREVKAGLQKKLEEVSSLFPGDQAKQAFAARILGAAERAEWFQFGAIVQQVAYVTQAESKNDYLLSYYDPDGNRLFLAKEFLLGFKEPAYAVEFVFREIARQWADSPFTEQEVQKLFGGLYSPQALLRKETLLDEITRFLQRRVIPWQLQPVLEKIWTLYAQDKKLQAEQEAQKIFDTLIGFQSRYLRENLSDPLREEARKVQRRGTPLDLKLSYRALQEMGVFDSLMRDAVEKLRITLATDADLEMLRKNIEQLRLYARAHRSLFDTGRPQPLEEQILTFNRWFIEEYQQYLKELRTLWNDRRDSAKKSFSDALEKKPPNLQRAGNEITDIKNLLATFEPGLPIPEVGAFAAQLHEDLSQMEARLKAAREASASSSRSEARKEDQAGKLGMARKLGKRTLASQPYSLPTFPPRSEARAVGADEGRIFIPFFKNKLIEKLTSDYRFVKKLDQFLREVNRTQRDDLWARALLLTLSSGVLPRELQAPALPLLRDLDSELLLILRLAAKRILPEMAKGAFDQGGRDKRWAHALQKFIEELELILKDVVPRPLPLLSSEVEAKLGKLIDEARIPNEKPLIGLKLVQAANPETGEFEITGILESFSHGAIRLQTRRGPLTLFIVSPDPKEATPFPADYAGEPLYYVTEILSLALPDEPSRSEVRAEIAEHVVNYFRLGVPFVRAEVREIVEAGVDRLVPPVEAAIAKYEEQDLLQAEQGWQLVQGIDQPVVLGNELTGGMSGAALKRLVSTMVGAVRANKFIALRLKVPSVYERRIRDLILLEKTNKKDPVKLLPAGDDLILYNQNFPENVSLTGTKPAFIIRPDFKNEELPQLDPNHYGNEGGRISPENRAEVFTAALLWVSDSLSKQTAEIISRDPARHFLYHLSSPAALGPLAQIGFWLMLTSTKAVASAA